MNTADCHVEGTMAYAQREAIERTLIICGYNFTRSAEQLRIGRTTLYRLVSQYKIRLDHVARAASPRAKRAEMRSEPANVVLIDGNWYLVPLSNPKKEQAA